MAVFTDPVYVLCETPDGLAAVGPFADASAVTEWEETHTVDGRNVVRTVSPDEYLARKTR